MVLLKTVESDYTDSIDGGENEDLTFLTFANLKICVSVHFLKVVLTKVQDTCNERLKKQSVIGTNIKTTCEIIALYTSIQPVFSYIMPPKNKITSYFRHKTVKVSKKY